MLAAVLWLPLGSVIQEYLDQNFGLAPNNLEIEFGPSHDEGETQPSVLVSFHRPGQHLPETYYRANEGPKSRLTRESTTDMTMLFLDGAPYAASEFEQTETRFSAPDRFTVEWEMEHETESLDLIGVRPVLLVENAWRLIDLGYPQPEIGPTYGIEIGGDLYQPSKVEQFGPIVFPEFNISETLDEPMSLSDGLSVVDDGLTDASFRIETEVRFPGLLPETVDGDSLSGRVQIPFTSLVLARPVPSIEVERISLSRTDYTILDTAVELCSWTGEDIIDDFTYQSGTIELNSLENAVLVSEGSQPFGELVYDGDGSRFREATHRVQRIAALGSYSVAAVAIFGLPWLSLYLYGVFRLPRQRMRRKVFRDGLAVFSFLGVVGFFYFTSESGLGALLQAGILALLIAIANRVRLRLFGDHRDEL